MGMPTPTHPARRWTADEARALQDEARTWPRYECIDGGLLVSPAPRPAHYEVQLALYDRLTAYLRDQGIGRAFMSPTDVSLEPGTTVQPDVYVVPGSPRMRLRAWAEITRLLLVVEVLSPSTARYDRLVKRRFFARAGVPEYWILDPDTRLLERSYPDGRVDVLGDERVTWHPEGAREPFVLDLPAFFREVLGDGDDADAGPGETLA
jgi:Uma2 family endonuclease